MISFFKCKSCIKEIIIVYSNMWLSQSKTVPKIYSCNATIADVNPFSLMNISHCMDTEHLFISSLGTLWIIFYGHMHEYIMPEKLFSLGYFWEAEKAVLESGHNFRFSRNWNFQSGCDSLSLTSSCFSSSWTTGIFSIEI